MAKKRATVKPEEATGGEQPGVNKTKAVHDYMRAHPKSKPAEIAAALQQEGIDITAGYVSTIRTNMKKKRRAKRRAVKEVVQKTGLDIPQIKAALGLLKVCGSVAAANDALAAAEEIRKAV